MPEVKIKFLDPVDLMVVSDGNQSEGKAATYLDLESPLPCSNANILKLHQAINSLPCQQYKIIKLFLKGFSNKEIATRVRISQKQVATQKANAVKRLKQMILSK